MRKEFDELKVKFLPHGELWETVHEVKHTRDKWLKSKINTINADDVDNLVR
jgi:hypothetical protein